MSETFAPTQNGSSYNSLQSLPDYICLIPITGNYKVDIYFFFSVPEEYSSAAEHLGLKFRQDVWSF